MKSDHRSKFSNLSNWKEEAWKKSRLQRVSTTIQVSPNTNLLCGSQHPLSACRQTICLLPDKQFLLFLNLVLPIWTRDQFILHRSRNSRRDFFVGPSSLVGQFLHPPPVRSRSIASACRKSDCFKTSFFNLGQQFGDRPVYASQTRKLRKRFFGETSSLVAQLLNPSPVQSSRSVLRIQPGEYCS